MKRHLETSSESSGACAEAPLNGGHLGAFFTRSYPAFARMKEGKLFGFLFSSPFQLYLYNVPLALSIFIPYRLPPLAAECRSYLRAAIVRDSTVSSYLNKRKRLFRSQYYVFARRPFSRRILVPILTGMKKKNHREHSNYIATQHHVCDTFGASVFFFWWCYCFSPFPFSVHSV